MNWIGAVGIVVTALWGFMALSILPVAWITGKQRTWVYWGRVESKRIDGKWFATDDNGQKLVINLGPDFDTDNDPSYDAMMEAAFGD